MHLLAATQVIGFTPNLRGAAAAYLVERSLIQVDTASGVCSTSSLADMLNAVHFRPQDGSCTCHDRAMHGTCCHLLAAAQLPEFQGAVLAVGVLEGNGATVRGTAWIGREGCRGPNNCVKKQQHGAHSGQVSCPSCSSAGQLTHAHATHSFPSATAIPTAHRYQPPPHLPASQQ